MISWLRRLFCKHEYWELVHDGWVCWGCHKWQPTGSRPHKKRW